ncbi:MAG: hypothetical protein O6852_03245 [Gammaproteobacteria bacterium]|nr:hypothetical protein [Gammaproteobacteria bacterium]
MPGNSLFIFSSKGIETKTSIYSSHCICEYGETRIDFKMEIDTKVFPTDTEKHSLQYQNEINAKGKGITFEPIEAQEPRAIRDSLNTQIIMCHSKGSML